jgi:hypothetical protein
MSCARRSIAGASERIGSIGRKGAGVHGQGDSGARRLLLVRGAAAFTAQLRLHEPNVDRQGELLSSDISYRRRAGPQQPHRFARSVPDRHRAAGRIEARPQPMRQDILTARGISSLGCMSRFLSHMRECE